MPQCFLGPLIIRICVLPSLSAVFTMFVSASMSVFPRLPLRYEHSCHQIQLLSLFSLLDCSAPDPFVVRIYTPAVPTHNASRRRPCAIHRLSPITPPFHPSTSSTTSPIVLIIPCLLSAPHHMCLPSHLSRSLISISSCIIYLPPPVIVAPPAVALSRAPHRPHLCALAPAPACDRASTTLVHGLGELWVFGWFGSLVLVPSLRGTVCRDLDWSFLPYLPVLPPSPFPVPSASRSSPSPCPFCRLPPVSAFYISLSCLCVSGIVNPNILALLPPLFFYPRAAAFLPFVPAPAACAFHCHFA